MMYLVEIPRVFLATEQPYDVARQLAGEAHERRQIYLQMAEDCACEVML